MSQAQAQSQPGQPGQDSDQLALCLHDLIVKAPQHALAAAALIVLNEGDINPGFGEEVRAPGLEKIAAVIPQDVGFDDQDIGDFGLCDVQDFPSNRCIR